MFDHSDDHGVGGSGELRLDSGATAVDEPPVTSRHRLNARAEGRRAAYVDRDVDFVSWLVGETRERRVNSPLTRMIGVELIIQRLAGVSCKREHPGVFARTVVVQRPGLLVFGA